MLFRSALQSLQRYLGVTTFIVVCLVIDCNNFFYKYLAEIPASHRVVGFRIFLWGFVSISTSKEWYEYVTNPNSNRLGPFAWMTFYVSIIELSSVYKFRGNEFINSFPTWVYAMWTVIFCLFLTGLVKAFRNGQLQKKETFNFYNPAVEVYKQK